MFANSHSCAYVGFHGLYRSPVWISSDKNNGVPVLNLENHDKIRRKALVKIDLKEQMIRTKPLYRV